MFKENKAIKNSHFWASNPMQAGKPWQGGTQPKIVLSEGCTSAAQDSEESCFSRGRIIWLGYCPWIVLGRPVEQDD